MTIWISFAISQNRKFPHIKKKWKTRKSKLLTAAIQKFYMKLAAGSEYMEKIV